MEYVTAQSVGLFQNQHSLTSLPKDMSQSAAIIYRKAIYTSYVFYVSLADVFRHNSGKQTKRLRLREKENTAATNRMSCGAI